MDKRTNYRYYRLKDGIIIDTKDETGYEVLEVGNHVDAPLVLKHYATLLGVIVRMGDEVGQLLDHGDLVRFKNGDVYQIRPAFPSCHDYLQGPIHSFETVTPLSRYYKPEDVYGIFKASEEGYRLIAYKHHLENWVFPVKVPWTNRSADDICGMK